MTYFIHYKEFGDKWRYTTYTTPDPVTDDFLIDFFGLSSCESFSITHPDD